MDALDQLAWMTPTGYDVWPRHERLKWHEARIRTEEKAVQLLLGTNSEKTDFEVFTELEFVRQEKRRLEGMLKVLESPEFMQLLESLDLAIRAAKANVHRRLQLMSCPGLPWLNGRADAIERLKASEEFAIKQARQVEAQMTRLAKRLDVDVQEYTRTDKLEWR